MRDPLTTRKLLAQIDRNLDVYVCLDRFRQAIYDQDDDVAKLEKRIMALEQEKVRWLTDSTLLPKLDAYTDKRAVGTAARLMWGALAGFGTLLIAFITWALSAAFKAAR